MKRTILLLAVVVTIVLGAKAQQQTATLQRGNSTTYYYGADAFKEAYNAANDGSIITLSAGYFNTVDSVTKQITIRGNGYTGEKTVIGKPGENAKNKFFSLWINANNVRLEGLYVEYSIHPVSDIENLFVGNCYTPCFGYQASVKNVIIDKCKILLIGPHDGLCVKNSFVNVGYSGLYLNCVVGNFYSRNTYRNCLINVNNSDGTISFRDDKEYLNIVFFGGVSSLDDSSSEIGWHASSTIDESTRYSTPTLPDIETSNIKGNTVALFDDIFNYTNEENPLYAPIITTITGDDGTVVGPYGGTGFSEASSIPRITESKIDTYTDGEGKLNVKVKVEVGQ